MSGIVMCPMSTTADEVLELRKKYKRAKAQYRAGRVTAEPEPVKKARKPRAKRDPSDKQKANTERLKAQVALAKEIRAKDPSMKWTEAIKAASAQMKK